MRQSAEFHHNLPILRENVPFFLVTCQHRDKIIESKKIIVYGVCLIIKESIILTLKTMNHLPKKFIVLIKVPKFLPRGLLFRVTFFTDRHHWWICHWDEFARKLKDGTENGKNKDDWSKIRSISWKLDISVLWISSSRRSGNHYSKAKNFLSELINIVRKWQF